MIDSIRPLTQEDHDANEKYRVGGLFTLGSVTDSDIYFQTTPKPYYPPSWVLNQGEFEANNDECAGCGTSRAGSFLNGYHCGPHFIWMMARQRAAEKIGDYGVSLRDIADTWRNVGMLRFEDEPFTFKDGRDTIQDPTKWANLPQLGIKAAEQLCGSVFWIHPSNGMDAFDTYRATIVKLNKMYGKIHVAGFGMKWSYPMTDTHMDKPVENGSGHFVPLIWANGDYVIALQSYGLAAGNNGEQKIHRSIINRWAEVYGMFIATDATRAEIEAVLAKGGKLDDPWRLNIVRAIIDAFKKNFPLLVIKLDEFLNPKITMIPPKITKLAGLIRDYEGGPGDRNYRNNNPGNCRYHFGGYLFKYGKVTCDKDGFAVFASYEMGWLYLQNMLVSWAQGYRGNHTVLQMMKEYAPTSDGNDPVAYAKYITEHLGVDAGTLLKDLL